MRSNLLSLQNISGQVSLTQNRLATGKKVNSAIDNPSSFYTASSLNNRAKDLDNLLDAMSQATSTIKAAITALETATTFLEQASAVATQALESAIPAKEYFEELVGENGAVVSTAQELKDAVASGKETICIYGKIDYFENETIELKDGQNLVGTEYFTGYTGKEKFSQINFTGSQANSILCKNTNNTISDLKLMFKDITGAPADGIMTRDGNLILKNVDASITSTSSNPNLHGVLTGYYSNITIDGINNLEADNQYGSALGLIYTNADIVEGATVNIKARSFREGFASRGIMIYYDSTLNIYGTVNSDCGLFALCAEGTASNNINIASTAIVRHVNAGAIFIQQAKTELNINIDQGALLECSSQGNKYAVISNGFNSTGSLSHANIMTSSSFTETESTIDWDNWQAVEEREKDTSAEDAGKQYSEILSQYDNLISDASYKGINLLKQDSLKVNFNENGNSNLSVNGKDMSSASLGFETKSWASQSDIVKSVKELTAALNSIRSYDAELGNNYSIITSRQNFTESLINILTEGADKLLLADMNEESANMLALQTRQQLAVNSLSLASQASQSVLKLF